MSFDPLFLIQFFYNVMSRNQSSVSQSAYQQQQHCENCNSRQHLEDHESEESSAHEESSNSSLSVNFILERQRQANATNSIKILEEEVKNLKIQNEQKDFLIMDLQKNMKALSSNIKLKDQVQKQASEIKRLKMKLNDTQYLKINTQNLKSKNYLFQLQKDVHVHHKKKKQRSKTHKYHQEKFQTKDKKQVESALQDFSNSQNEQITKLKISLDKLRQIEKHKNELVVKVQDLEAKLQNYSKEISWMGNLMSSLISMAEKLSYFFNQKVIKNSWEFRKKAKVSWRYLKHIVQYLIPTD